MSNSVPRFRRRNGNGKNPDGQREKMEIFCGAKNTTRPLTAWIGETGIERGLFLTGRCAILEHILFSMNLGEDLSWGFLYNF